MDRRKVARWLTALCKNKGQDILRAKGIIDVKDNNRRLVFQAVHMILEGDLQREWKPGEAALFPYGIHRPQSRSGRTEGRF